MAIMAKFPTITQPCSKDHLIKHDITHHIDMTGPPVSARPRRLAPERLKIAGHLHSTRWLKSREIGVHAVTIEH